MPVLLFDIDGTLLQSHGVGRRSVTAALDALAGDTFDFSDVEFSGKTDRQIFREVLEAGQRCGLDVSPDQADALGELYRSEMETNLPQATVEGLPGAVALVRRLAETETEMGMLTGNLEPLAYLKIEQIGLGRDELPFGAFGSDDADRNALPAVAARRASERYGREVTPDQLVVIGDTPRDIACARAVGATAVAVATGRYSADDLREADVVLDTLEAFDLAALA
ncbi:HAD family hydrolase [Rubrivirga sp.]|uniref:HAD family hydrolase n=1 Tax=Rubrivirga sp. TaxID=1885344 RepID=UPI003B52063B